MRAYFSKKFLKDLAKIPKEQRRVVEYFAFKVLPELRSLDEIKSLKKLQGHSSAYRIRFGDYRVGLMYESDGVTLERVVHRSHFYRKFP